MRQRGEPSPLAHLDNQKLSSTQAVSCSCTKISTSKLETPRKIDYLLVCQMSYTVTWPLEGILHCRVKQRHTACEQHR